MFSETRERRDMLKEGRRGVYDRLVIRVPKGEPPKQVS
jgi:hypothetical protein